MEPSNDSICVRSMRLDSMLNGPTIMSSRALDKELLFDSITLMFDECNNDVMKRDPSIASFLDKFKMVVPELKSLRVNRLDFESKQVIGKGNFGEVELVVEKHTNDIFAMKVLKKDNFDNHNIASFEHERDIMASSSSPFLTRLHYAFHDFQNLYLVMEYHPGGDFAHLIDKFNGTLPEDTAKFYIAELLLAVKHLHAMGYAHRDIKPENMMLDRTGHLKLVDFGSSAKLDRDNIVKTRMAIGASEYIAPEVLQFMESSSIDGYSALCDLWSAGIVAYKMATGDTPFNAEQQAVIYSNILSFDNSLKYPSFSNISPAYKQMIECLVCHVEKRFTVDMMINLEIFSKINFDSIHEQVPPCVPSLSSDKDVTNFPIHERARPTLNMQNFKKQKQFSGRDLPFIGFTYSSSMLERNQQHSISIPELETTIKIKQKELEDAHVLIHAYEEKVTEYDRMMIVYEEKIKKMEEENVLLHKEVLSLGSELSRLTRISEETTLTRNDDNDMVQKKQAEMVKNEIDKWENKTIKQLCNLEELKSQNEYIRANNTELQTRLVKNLSDIKVYQENEEQLNKTIAKLKSKLKHIVRRSKQMTEENIDNHVASLTAEMKTKEDAFDLKINKLNEEKHALQKEMVVMQKDLDSLNSKLSQNVAKETTVQNEHKATCLKMVSDFEAKLSSVRKEKDNEIEQLHTKITQLQQQFSESLISFEKHENTIFTKETEKEFESELKTREQQIKELELNFKILDRKHKTCDETISGLKEYHKDARANYKQEITKIKEETSLQIKIKEDQVEDLNNKIKCLNNTIDSLQLKLEKEVAESNRLSNELAKIVTDSKRWTSEKSCLERSILEMRIKLNNSESNVKTLQVLVTVQSDQMEGLEVAVQSMMAKEKQLLENIKSKTDEIEKLKNDVREVKKLSNEEKSLRILAENKAKMMNSVNDNMKEELNLLTDQNVKINVEIDSLKKQLEESDSSVREKSTLVFTLQDEFEKVVNELDRVKSDLSATISQKQLLKEANIRLTQRLEETVEDTKVMQNIIEKYKNSLFEQKTYYDKRLIKADVTISQQTKLIDYLQTKFKESTTKKRTLVDLLFSGKNKVNVEQKEIELLLNSERSKSKHLATILNQAQAELEVAKAQCPLQSHLVPTRLDFDFDSPVSSKSTPIANPVSTSLHKFDVKICKRGGLLCSHCQLEVTVGQQLSDCQECRVSTHVTCSHELLADCTGARKKDNDGNQAEIESWITVWDNTIHVWDRKYAKIENGGVLCILNDKHDCEQEPFFTLSLSQSSDMVKVVDVAQSNDKTFDKDTDEDYEQLFKVEVYNSYTGHMTIFLYIIAPSVQEKQQWLSVIRQHSANNDDRTNRPQHDQCYKDIIFTFQKDKMINVNCVHQITQSVHLLGADEGLFSVHLKTQNGEVKRDIVSIVGPKQVINFVFLPKIQIVLMVAGPTRELLKCDMRNVVLNSELSVMSRPNIESARVIDEIGNSRESDNELINELNEINCLAVSHCNELVVVGSEHNITVLKWQDIGFFVTKIIKTNVPTKCICFTPTGIIFTTNSFYKIDTEDFSCKRFYTDAIAKAYDYCPIYVCELSKNKEYLLCYGIYGIFVDSNGKKTRGGEMKWPYSPKSFAFQKPYLVILSESEITIIKITQSCCVEEDRWSITSTKQPNDQIVLNINCPKLLGNNFYLKDTNNYQGTCSVFQLNPSKILKSSTTDSSSTLDTHYTAGSFFEFSLLDNLDKEEQTDDQ
ncbi:citron Rho-interacting kinase-like isoform X2 [Adelges cooleyi]|uniref:citron Rho-interacting kinase-like isoform X2 n=1 Tax=Adelges cooleyi TaxID=133065 RepID=UPI0021807DD8|nr:citron Rho-interacting kinase-like isoform X2 [Adelges cooleyi]